MEKNPKIFREIDPEIYRLDDDRVRLLSSGEMTQLEFMRLTALDDPWEARQSVLKFIKPKEIEMRVTQFKENYVKYMKKTGGLSGVTVHTHKDAFLSVYPEIKPLLDKALSEIEKEECKGCAMNAKMQPVVEMILSLPTRDISSLPKLDDKILTRLRGEEVVIEDKNIPVPPGIIKKNIPLLPEGVEHHTQAPLKRCDGKIIPVAISEFNRAIQSVNESFFKLIDSSDEVIPFEFRNDKLTYLTKEEQKASVLIENPFNIARKAREDCGRKHISNAINMLKMSKKSTDKREKFLYAMRACAELNEAYDELIQYNKTLPDKLRAIRISIMEQK